MALHSNISGLCRPQSSAAGHGACPGAATPPPSKPKGPPCCPPSLSTAAVSPGKPFCHLLSHPCDCPYIRTKRCSSEPSLSWHMGWTGQKKAKLGKSSNLPHKSSPASKTRQSPLLPRLAYLVKDTCPRVYI